MKFIFDSDDVLLNNTKQLKEEIIAVLGRAGVPRVKVEEYWARERLNRFSLKKMLVNFALDEVLYEEVMQKCSEFVNKELIDVVRKLGKENCYLVSYGDYEFNTAKVERSGLAPFFREVIIVPGSKKEAVERICATHKDEKVIFVDDKAYNFEDLDMQKCSNLTTILYDDHGLEKLTFILSQS